MTQRERKFWVFPPVLRRRSAPARAPRPPLVALGAALGPFPRWSCACTPLVCALALAFAGCSNVPLGAGPTANERFAEARELSLRAQKAQRAGKTDQAIDLYRRALDLQPNMRGVWNNLGNLLIEKQAYLDAVEALKREADLSPDDPRPYSNLGLAYYRAGWAEESLRYHELALERDPYCSDSLRGVALAAQRINRADDKTAEILRRGLMVESDPQWRAVFETERLRVEGQMREQKANSRTKPPAPGIS